MLYILLNIANIALNTAKLLPNKSLYLHKSLIITHQLLKYLLFQSHNSPCHSSLYKLLNIANIALHTTKILLKPLKCDVNDNVKNNGVCPQANQTWSFLSSQSRVANKEYT